MSTATDIITEAQILERVVMPDQNGFSPEAARAILQIRFDTCAIERMGELAEKNSLGSITDTERAEMANYVRVGNFLNLMQAMARFLLPTGP